MPKQQEINYFNVLGHSRFLCARAFEKSKPHTTCSKESVRKVTQFGPKVMKKTYFMNKIQTRLIIPKD